MIRIFSKQIEKLHSRDGQALVFVAMVGVLIFLFFAMTMNLAELVQLKIKNQNVADAAAMSAAVWQARALNTVSALNQNIMDWWVTEPLRIAMLLLNSQGCGIACCAWQCMMSPACLGCFLFVAIQVGLQFLYAFMVIDNGKLQKDVLNSFDEEFLLADLPSIVDLNYNFKPNTKTEDIDTDLYMYLNENNGNIFLQGAGGPGTDFFLERGGFCELIIGILYNYCRRGRISTGGCGAGFWTFGMGSMYRQIAAGPGGGVDDWYSEGGLCQGSSAANTPWGNVETLTFFLPYVLRTFVNTPGYAPVNPEEAIPITTGVYREEWPPIMHMWGAGFRRDMDCASVPDDVFPCTDQGHFSFSTAHAFSPSVADFYWHFYTPSLWTMGYTTTYPVPLVPAITDWEARLFPMEPQTEEGGRSPHGGTTAYNDIADQVQVDLGNDARSFLEDNVLSSPIPPFRDFFLY